MSYQQSYSKIVTGVTEQQIWAIWSDLNKRALWDDDTEWAQMSGEFVLGSTFLFKPKNGPKLTMQITECTSGKSFTDCFKLPLAKLYGDHNITRVEDGLRLTTTIRVTGPLAWLWKRVIAKKIVATLPKQTESLVNYAKKVHS